MVEDKADVSEQLIQVLQILLSYIPPVLYF